jgi:acyl-coenzyme A thioesterase PaaI-like protein
VQFDEMKHSVTELPFNSFLGLESCRDGELLLRLPAGDQYLNHLGTVHASALLSLAEAAGGECLLQHFGTSDGVVPVVRRLEAKFRKPANGVVGAKASLSEEQVTQLKGNLAAKGRAVVTVQVELYDMADSHVLSATVEWFVAAEVGR